MNLEIANRLMELRKKSSLSQEQLAEKLGISRQAVSKWERAESSPDTDNLIALSRIYNISIDSLLKTDEEISIFPSNDNGPRPKIYLDGDLSREDDNFPEYKLTSMEKKVKHYREQFPYTVFITMVYLVLGFAFDWWHPGWLVFLLIPVFYSRLAVVPMAATIMFFVLGFLFDMWAVAWMVFLFIPFTPWLNSLLRKAE